MGRYITELTLRHLFKVWFADVHRFHDVFWQARISVHPFWLVVDFDAAILIIKTQVTISTKRASVGQKWPNHGTCVEWEYKSSISWTYLCSCDFKRQAFSPFCAWDRICFQRLAAWVSSKAQTISYASDVKQNIYPVCSISNINSQWLYFLKSKTENRPWHQWYQNIIVKNVTES